MPPHGSEPVLHFGNTVNPSRALILLHGRGGSAEDIAGLVPHLALAPSVLVLVPQATDYTWYPKRFIEPQANNQPYLDAALDRVYTLVAFLETAYGITADQVTLAGFSQGACLTAEYLKRFPRRYLGAAVWSGGLIGDQADVTVAVPGSLANTPVYVGCDVEDFHIPKERVEATADYLRAHGAEVTLRLYENAGHTIHEEGLQFLAHVLRA